MMAPPVVTCTSPDELPAIKLAMLALPEPFTCTVMLPSVWMVERADCVNSPPFTPAVPSASAVRLMSAAPALMPPIPIVEIEPFASMVTAP